MDCIVRKIELGMLMWIFQSKYSKLHELKEKAPEWIEKTEEAVDEIKYGHLQQV